MGATGSRASHRSPGHYWLAGGLALVAVTALLVATQSVGAANATVGLGTATPFGVLAGSTVTNTVTATIVNGDLGVSPGSAVTGFPPGIVNGTQHVADGVAANAQADLITAYNDAASRAPSANIAGGVIAGATTLFPGVYNASSSLGVGGTLTLDAQNDPNAVFIFQVPTTLVTASGTTIALINRASACNVFWQVGTSATLGTGTTFQGSILALASITVTTGVIMTGRALARNGAVTLDNDTITNSACATVPVSTPTTAAPRPTATPKRSTPAPSPARTPGRRRTPAPTPAPAPTLSGPPSPAPAPRPARGTFPVTG